jgi:tetratricopeptide (TPR) repeat protein
MRSVDVRALWLVACAAAAGCASPPREAAPAPAQAVTAAPATTQPARTSPSAATAPVALPAAAERGFDEAKAMLRAGRSGDAERAFKMLAVQYPQLGGVHANLGLMARIAGRYDEAVAAFEQAVKLSPQQPVFQAQLGLAYRMKGRFNDARAAYERALELDPAYADAHLNLGILLDLYLGESTLALNHYERYVALAPGGDAVVGKWIADLKTRNKPSSVAAVDVKLSKKE